MKEVIICMLVLAFCLLFGIAQYTLAAEGRLVYTGESDPEQVNGNVDGGGHISTSGDTVKIAGAWSVISTAPMTAAHMPANQGFEAAWKYIAMVENLEQIVPRNGGSGLTIKYYDAEGGSRIDEYRMIIGNNYGNLEVFWANWPGSGYGAAGWTESDTLWKEWGGCSRTSVPVPIPDSRYFKVAYDGTNFEVYYSVTGDAWVHIPEMTLPKDSLINKDITVDDPNAVREFQFPSRDGVQVNLDWLVIKGEGLPNFNENVEIGIEDLGGGRLMYSGENDPEQINGNVDGGGHIETSGDTVKIAGAWAVISTAPMTAARMYASEKFEAAWKYVSSAELPSGGGSGLTIKYYDGYNSVNRVDEYRMIVGNRDGDLEVFWANWPGSGYGAADWTESDYWSTWGGCSRTSVPVDVPDDAVYFRVTYDGNKFEVFYSVAGDLWTPLPDMTLNKYDLINRQITVDDSTAGREFQFPSKGGAEVKLDWLVIKGRTFPNFNPNVEVGVEDLGGIKEEPRLYAHYPLDDSSDIATDVVGGNHGVLYNYAEGDDKWVEGAPESTSPEGGLYFDGVDDVVVIPNMLNEGSITIAFWAQPQNISAAWRAYVAYDRVFEAAWGGPWIGQAGSFGQIQFAVVFQDTSTGDTREQMFVTTDSYWEDFTWSHVACTWNADTHTRKTYFNGEFVEENHPSTAETPDSSKFVRTSGGNQIIFGMWNYQGLDGQPHGQAEVILDDVRFYNYALSAEEIALLVTAVDAPHTAVPVQFELAQNFPNPFNPTTEIRFKLAKKSKVELTVYDVLGRTVATLVDDYRPAGSYRAVWDASGKSSGIYFYRLKTDDFDKTKKMILVK